MILQQLRPLKERAAALQQGPILLPWEYCVWFSVKEKVVVVEGAVQHRGMTIDRM